MKDKNLVFSVNLSKFGDTKLYKTVHIIANNYFQAAHEMIHLLDDGDNFDVPVSVIGINQVVEIDDILNANDFVDDDENAEYDPETPYKVVENENFPKDHIMKFKCSCQNEQIVADFGWPYLICRDCKRQVLHKDLESVGGMWIYHPSN